MRHLSPQGTLLSLGVLLLLAAGVTFLAVNWDSLPVSLQAGIIGTLAVLAFAGSVPASRRSLAGTAEALAILGCGLLTVDLYGVRALGLGSLEAIDWFTYSAIVFGSLALINLLMTRTAQKVVTYGVTTVIAGQLPLALILVDRTSLPVLLAALLAQVVITLILSAKGTAIVRRTGAITSAVVFCGILLAGMARTFAGLLATYSGGYLDLGPVPTHAELLKTIATAAVVCLAAATGLVILRRRPLPASVQWGLGEAVCAAAAGFTVATCLPQIPGPGRWLTTGVLTALGIAEIMLARRTGKLALVLHVAIITVTAVDLLFCLARDDIRQLGFLAAIVAVLAVSAALRKVVDAVPAAGVASLAAQLAIMLFAGDEFIGLWAAAVSLALVGAAGIGLACRYVGQPLERVLMSTAALAVVLAQLMALMVTATETATGVVLTIAAAPLIAYGMSPARRIGLLVAGLLLIIANTAFVVASGATTVELFTVPPAVVMLAIGVLAWRNESSWVYLGPGLLIGLVPSALLADSNDNWIRVTFVVAAALAVILVGVYRGLQAPFVIGAAVLAKIGIWQFLEVAPLIPRWITLGAAGTVLLTVGATYERRLTQAKQAARWVTALR
ncbi:SCO7613 C-terminal domain-containing membrane protein [Kribbella sp. NBC_00359]|uniref:SCO7613 C-terminal domain-containing membrane protein n=1 Tax=Kribbella sp. NBC_00359 TaxID=2975966 RepID=UPI002E22BF4C